MESKNESLLITKASGKIVPFAEDKLRHSLKNAGANDSVIDTILNEIHPKLFQGITTKKIYRLAFNLLRESSGSLAARYHLKRAIMELGPSGYPFEKYVAALLSQQGYSVTTGQTIKGKCVSHEVDVVAKKDERYFMIECKYHNQPGTICDVKIPLYIQARFKDVEQQEGEIQGRATKFNQAWVVTNTRFSSDAIQYGICAGLNLIGWDYPKKGSLKNLIDSLGLYPVTCLVSLTKVEKQRLLDAKIVLSREICDTPQLLTEISVKPARIRTVLDEARNLCHQLKSNK
jgi:hypothetical protein